MKRNHPHPGRPRSFDVDKVLESATDTFHQDGLAGTTYERLEAATGLRRQSLVYAFGDKRTLFKAALAHYADKKVGQVIEVLGQHDSPAEGVRRAFALWLADARHKQRPGCLLVNTAGEVGGSDNELAESIEAATARLVDAFEQAFSRAKAAGELKADAKPRDLAQTAVALGDGALLHARSAGNAKLAKASFKSFLDMVLH